MTTVALIADPFHRTPADRAADFAVWMENRARYIQQSAQTQANDPAPLPPRAPALPLTTNARNTA